MNTEIEIPVSELKPVLPGLAKIVSRSSRLPVLQHIKVSQDADGIRLQAHNLDEIATVHLPGSGGNTPRQFLVPLDLLTKITKGCTAGQTIGLLSTGTETRIRYTVAGSLVERSVTHIPASEWPEVKSFDQEAITLDETFKIALREATQCASEDSSRYVLNGTCLDTRDKNAHYVVGTDGRHLYAANTFRFDLPESLIVPTRKFLGWPGFNEDGPWSLQMLPAVKNAQDKGKAEDQPAWLRIDSNHWSYVARAIDGVYPTWKQVVPSDTATWTRIVLQPAAVDMLLEALPLLPCGDSSDRAVTIAASDGLVVKARGKDQAEWTSINVPEVNVTGANVQTTLNRTFLLKALRFGLHQVAIKSSLDALVFFSESKTMVVMPLRCAESGTASSAQVTAPSPPQAIPVTTPVVAEPNQEPEQRTPVGDSPRVQQTAKPEQDRSPSQSALDHVNRIKSNLRDLMGELTEIASLLKATEKEQRSSAREIETIRAKLREIQSVAI